MWAGGPQERDDAVVIRCHCFSSLKAKKCMLCIWLLRNQVMFFQPHAHALQKKVRHAVTLQFSCSTWKTSWDKTTVICPLTLLLLTTCSNGMSPLSLMFLHSLWKASHLERVNMARLYIGLSVVTACTLRRQIQLWPCTGTAASQYYMRCFVKVNLQMSCQCQSATHRIALQMCNL